MKMDVSQLWDATSTMEKTAETANAVGFFTRTRLRQECVLDRVLPPQFITQNDLERNTNDDYPLIRVEKELDTVAFSLGFRGSAEGDWFDGQKYEIYFGQVRTQEHNKTQEELMTMRAPVVDYFNRNGVFDLGAKADTTFRAGLDASAAASSNVITSAGTALAKSDAVAMLKQMEIKRMPAGCWVVTESRWNDILEFTPNDIGYTLVGELAINGAKKIPTFLDIPVVRTIEAIAGGGASMPSTGTIVNSVWDNKSMYLLTTPDFLGKNFILQDVQYHMERKYNLLTWAAWMTRGAGIGNINGVVRTDWPNAGI